MARSITTEIVINSSLETVWRVLTDLSAYSEWNEFIVSAKGTASLGEKLAITIAVNPQKTMTFKPTIMSFKPHEEFSWLGRFVIPGLFDGFHHFSMKEIGQGKVLFQQSEKFSGVLIPLIFSKMEQDTKQGFQRMNENLKLRCEKQ